MMLKNTGLYPVILITGYFCVNVENNTGIRHPAYTAILSFSVSFHYNLNCLFAPTKTTGPVNIEISRYEKIILSCVEFISILF